MTAERRPGAEARRRPSRRARALPWSRPRRSLRPSRAGWVFVGVTFGVGFAALNTGNNLLYLVLSLMLGFLVLSGFLSEAALRGVRVERRLPREVWAGRRNRVTLAIENADARLATFALVVEDRAREGGEERPVGRCFALRIAPGETVLRDYALEPAHRGPFRFTGYRLSTRFPFGLFVKSVWVEEEKEALVFPAVERVAPPDPAAGRASDAEEARTRVEGGVLMAGLREYSVGDGLRRVNWRQSMRRGALFVGDAEEERIAEVEVELSAPPATTSGDGFEGLVTRATSEVVHHLDAGLRVALRTPTHRFAAETGRRHRRALLHHLALVQPEAPGAEPAGGDGAAPRSDASGVGGAGR